MLSANGLRRFRKWVRIFCDAYVRDERVRPEEVRLTLSRSASAAPSRSLRLSTRGPLRIAPSLASSSRTAGTHAGPTSVSMTVSMSAGEIPIDTRSGCSERSTAWRRESSVVAHTNRSTHPSACETTLDGLAAPLQLRDVARDGREIALESTEEGRQLRQQRSARLE